MVALAAVLSALASDLERRKTRKMPQLPCSHLIDRDARAEIGPAGLARMTTRQETGHGARVVAAAVAERPRRIERQPADDQKVVLDGLERLEDRRQIEFVSLGAGRPIRHVHAIGNVQKGHAQRRLTATADFGAGRPVRHHIQQWQCQRRPQAPRAAFDVRFYGSVS